MLWINVLSQSLLALGSIANHRLEHGPNHIELSTRWTNESRRSVDLEAMIGVLLASQCRIIVGLLALVPVDASVAHGKQNTLGEILLAVGRLADHVA